MGGGVIGIQVLFRYHGKGRLKQVVDVTVNYQELCVLVVLGN